MGLLGVKMNPISAVTLICAVGIGESNNSNLVSLQGNFELFRAKYGRMTHKAIVHNMISAPCSCSYVKVWIHILLNTI